MQRETAASRLQRVQERMKRAADRAGRDPGSICLVAVGKTFPVPALRAMLEAGQSRLGENRVQEAEQKASQLGSDIEWHMVGHLQSNKAARAARLFDWIHGLDSPQLARRLSLAAAGSHRHLKALVQVNLDGEPQKSGVHPQQLMNVLAGMQDLEGLSLLGLMTVPLAGQGRARAAFKQLRHLALAGAENGLLPHPFELSMGMSADYEIAIEEGATLVRIGSALFGRRSL